jgi:hypothetical protein
MCLSTLAGYSNSVTHFSGLSLLLFYHFSKVPNSKLMTLTEQGHIQVPGQQNSSAVIVSVGPEVCLLKRLPNVKGTES